MKTSLKALIATFLLACTSHLHAVIDINVNFDNETVGEPPSTAPAQQGQPITKLTGLVQSGSAATIVEDYTVGSVTMPGKALLMTVLSDINPYFNIQGNPNDFAPNQDYAISLDLLFGEETIFTNASLSIRLNNNNAINADNFQSVVRFGFANSKPTLYLISGSSTTASFALPTDIYSGLIHLELRVLYSTGTLEAYINGSLVGSNVLEPKSPAGFNALQFIRTNQNSRFEVAIDNIRAYAIPESGSIAQLLVAAPLILGQRRKNQ